MQKYTKADLVDFISAKMITSDYKLNKKEIRDFMTIYETAVYELLLDGIPVSFGDVGIFKFKTIKEQEERKSPLPQVKGMLPAIPSYTKLKFQPNKILGQEIKQKTLGKPFRLK